MSKLFLSMLILLLSSTALAQKRNKETPAPDTWVRPDTIYQTKDLETPATFPGGMQAFGPKHLFKNLKYPQEARDRNITGKVILEMIITATGEVRDVIAVVPVNHYLAMEAVRVMKASPPWIPAMKDGKPVASIMRMPISFQLDQAVRFN